MNINQFKSFFLKLIGNKDNPYHPLVWINGEPKIGKNTYIGGFSELNAKGGEINIGENCDIASFVVINVADSHLKTIGLKKNIKYGKVNIGSNVFIGTQSSILGNVTINNFSVIGAGTVLRDCVIPEYSLVIGNPPIVKKNYYKKFFK